MQKIAQYFWKYSLLPGRLGRHFYKRLLRADHSISFPFTTDFYGIQYLGNLNNNIDFNIYFYGAFEKPLLYFLSDSMQSLTDTRSGTFIDIGANVGQHSLYMSRHSAQVHAFEPYAPVRDRLSLQINHNSITNIAVHPLGLSDTTTKLPFYAPTGSNAGIGSFDASSQSKGNKAIGELALMRGDEFFEATPVTSMDIVKIDVEGFEKPALRGLRSTLTKHRPLIVCEITYGKDLSISSMEELMSLLPENYQLFTFDKRKADGSKARGRDGKARLSGRYSVIPYVRMLATGQDDVIACPAEKVAILPKRN